MGLETSQRWTAQRGHRAAGNEAVGGRAELGCPYREKWKTCAAEDASALQKAIAAEHPCLRRSWRQALIGTVWTKCGYPLQRPKGAASTVTLIPISADGNADSPPPGDNSEGPGPATSVDEPQRDVERRDHRHGEGERHFACQLATLVLPRAARPSSKIGAASAERTQKRAPRPITGSPGDTSVPFVLRAEGAARSARARPPA